MRLTSRSEYALLSLIYMARRVEAKVSVSEIARAQKIPIKFLEQIFQTLKSGKLVISTKGRGGGYQLSRPADKVNLAEVVRLFEGHLAPTESVSRFYYRATPVEREKKLLNVLQEVRDITVSIMEKCTLADIL
jgi:Rrf2 family cysteine metabolism transcriptional repressor